MLYKKLIIRYTDMCHYSISYKKLITRYTGSGHCSIYINHTKLYFYMLDKLYGCSGYVEWTLEAGGRQCLKSVALVKNKYVFSLQMHP